MRVSIEGSCAEGLTAEEKVEDVMQEVANACDAVMPRKGKGNPHTTVYWWSDKIRAAPCGVLLVLTRSTAQACQSYQT